MAKEENNCGICGEPMQPGEEMFKYHGSLGPCPVPPRTREPARQKKYLGDGVYAATDGYHVILTTENGVEVTNEICLDDGVLAALGVYVESIKGKGSEDGEN